MSPLSRSSLIGFAIALVVAAAAGLPCPAVAQQSAESVPSTQAPKTPETSTPQPSTEVPSTPISGSQAPGSAAQGAGEGANRVELPPELQAEADQAKALFESRAAEFADAIIAMRQTYIKYLNGIEATPADKQRYRQQRDEARQKMDALYAAALDFIRYVPDEKAAQYVMTIVDHRLDHSDYNYSTAEGAARMIDGGVNLLYLFQAAARSGVVAGQFDMSRRLFESIEPEKLEDIDQRLMFQLDQLEQEYLAEQEIRAREAAEDRLPRVKLETTRGEVIVELFLDQAPSTVANFIQLVEQGFYDGVDFHQVVDDLLALTGDPTGLGSGGSGRLLVDEHERPDARKALRGSLVMAKLPKGNTGEFVPDSASSQFAILYLPLPQLTADQTVFGRVVEGMGAISALRRVDPSKEKKNDVVLPPDRILSATVLRRPETLPEPIYAK